MSIRYSPDWSTTVVALILLISLNAATAGAQSSPPGGEAAQSDTISPAPLPGDQKLPIESVKPYSFWKRHIAEKPEEALVLVRSGGAAITGLMIRCDGFVLVPRAIRDTARLGGSVDVTLRNVDRDDPKGSRATGTATTSVRAAARSHPRSHATVPYALIKTTGHHARSLPLLDSSVTPGMPIRILWFSSAGDGADAGPHIRSQNGVVGPAAGKKDLFSISPKGAGGTSVPSGAIVVDAESGGAVGMVTQAGTHPAFTTFARFHVISSEVGLAPDRPAVRLGDRSGTLPSRAGQMVFVPGGPVPLDGTMARDFDRSYGTTVACTPGFWMAVHPVTNGQYRQWLAGEKVRRLPAGWSAAEVQAPGGRREDRPACGMFVEDAAFYASARQSRLPTEVEWRRASYCRDTSWVEEMNQSWDAAGRHLDMLFALHQQHLDQAVAAARIAAQQSRGRGAQGVAVLAGTNDQLQADGVSMRQFLDQFLHGEWIWGHVAPIDAFRQDISVFGVRNILINAPEYVQGMTQQTMYAPKLFPSRVDPDLTQFAWAETGSGAGSGTGGGLRPGMSGASGNAIGVGDLSGRWSYAYSGGGDRSPITERLRQMISGYFLVRYWRGGSASWSGGISGTAGDEDETHSFTTRITARLHAHIYSGFRCAR